MYYFYIKKDSAFGSKKLIGEFADMEKIKEKLDAELAKNPDLKYVIEETTGGVDSYGNLIAEVIEEN